MATYYIDYDNGSDTTGTGLSLLAAWATLDKYLASTPAGGDYVWLRARSSGVIPRAATYTPLAGTMAAPTHLIGFGATPGDGVRPTLQWAGAASGFILTHANTHQITRSVILDSNLVAGTHCCHCTGGTNVYRYESVDFLNGGVYGLGVATGLVTVVDGKAKGCGTAGYFLPNAHQLVETLAVGNGIGYSVTSRGVYIGAKARGNTSHGWQMGTGSAGSSFQAVVAYMNGGDGVNLNGGVADWPIVLNSILVNNTGYEINSPTNVYGGDLTKIVDYNFFYVGSGAGARNNVPAGAHDVALSGDPFVDGAHDNYALAASGAGAQVRAHGWPGATTNGYAGSRDGGSLQHPDSAAAGSRQSRARTWGY